MCTDHEAPHRNSIYTFAISGSFVEDFQGVAVPQSQSCELRVGKLGNWTEVDTVDGSYSCIANQYQWQATRNDT